MIDLKPIALRLLPTATIKALMRICISPRLWREKIQAA
jgi:hypothetical protein